MFLSGGEGHDSRVGTLAYNQSRNAREDTHLFVPKARGFQIRIVKTPFLGLKLLKDIALVEVAVEKIGRHKVHYSGVIFRHRCLPQRVPWHFGQLRVLVWFVCK